MALAKQGADDIFNDIPIQRERANEISDGIKKVGRESIVYLADVSETEEVSQ